MEKKSSSSWEAVASWYDKIVGTKGHYYHEHIIIPGIHKLLNIQNPQGTKILDLGCGQGILARTLNKEISYLGIDISKSLIQAAKKHGIKNSQKFIVADLTKPFSLESKDFTHATIILALQNIADPLAVLKNAYAHLQENGKLIIVINHPCFRIPRQSSWQIDTEKKIQYRRIDRYFCTLKIPIQAHPSKAAVTEQTWSYHHPLADYFSWLKEAGFYVELVEEWISDKKSTGKAKAMEDRARQEFPLFFTFSARRLPKNS
jgi:ubiquinone/menaquinone biosynthesis C-methylase UbiE